MRMRKIALSLVGLLGLLPAAAQCAFPARGLRFLITMPLSISRRQLRGDYERDARCKGLWLLAD